MGQKVNPHGLRVGIIKDWDSKWYAEKDFADNLVEDHEIRTYFLRKDYTALVFPESRSRGHLTALRSLSIQQSLVS